MAGRGAGRAMGFRPSFLQRPEGDGTLWWGPTGQVGGTQEVSQDLGGESGGADGTGGLLPSERTSPFGEDRPLGLSPSRTWEVMCAPEASMTLRKEYDADGPFRHQEEAFSDYGVVPPPGPLAPTPKGPQPPTCTLLEPDQLSPASCECARPFVHLLADAFPAAGETVSPG